MTRTRYIIGITLGTLCAGIPAWAHSAHFEVGQNPSTGQVALHVGDDVFPFALPASTEPDMVGFANNWPGFVGLSEIEEPGTFEPLDPNAVIALQVLSADPAMKIWDPVAPGLLEITGANLLTFGSVPIHVHAWFHIDTSDPAYDPTAGPWAVTFQLVDTAGVYTPSAPFTATFTPEPSTLGLVACGALTLLRRRC